MRSCAVCKRNASEVKFSKQHRTCNGCRAKASRDYSREYQRSRRQSPEFNEKHRIRTREYRERFPYMALYTTSHYLAKKAGVHSDVTKEQAEELHNIPEICSYCGIDHEASGEKRAFPVDHIIPMIQGGPNSRWNMTKVCNRCNVQKSSASLVDFRNRTPDFTDDRYEAVIADMVTQSGYSREFIDELLTQSHEFERTYLRERERMVTLLSA